SLCTVDELNGPGLVGGPLLERGKVSDHGGGPSCCRGAGTYSHGQRDDLRTLGTADMRRRRVRAGVAAPRLAAHEVHAEALAADAVRDLQREVADPGSGQALEQLR